MLDRLFQKQNSAPALLLLVLLLTSISPCLTAQDTIISIQRMDADDQIDRLEIQPTYPGGAGDQPLPPLPPEPATIGVVQLQPSVTGLFDRMPVVKGYVSVSLSSEYTAASSALSSAFMNRLLWGGFIDADTKQDAQEIVDATDGNNVAGLEWANSAQVSFGIAKGPKGQLWSGHVRAHSALRLGVAFPDDLYTLLFYGNAALAGETASLDQTRVTYHRTQQLDLGVAYSFSFGKWSASLGLGGGVVQGIRHDDAHFDGSFFTASDGSQLDLGITGTYNRTDSTGKWTEAYGWGVVGNGLFHISRSLGTSSRGMVFVGVEDLGTIWWQSSASLYQVDSMYNFAGFSVDELNDLATGALSTEPDSLLDYLGASRENTRYTSRPGPLLSAGFRGYTKSWHYGAGYRQRLNSGQNPLFWGQAGIALAKGQFLPQATLAYGGWGAWQIGAEATWSPIIQRPEGKNSISPVFRLGATDLVGFLAPNAGRGGTAYVKLGARF